MRSLFAIVLLVLALFVAEAKTKRVNLDRLSEKKRTEYLIAKAKEVVMRHGPGYYRDYAPPVIERDVYDSVENMDSSYLAVLNRAFYMVYYPYDTIREIFWGKYSVKVWLWADTGEPFDVMFGCGLGFALDRLTEEKIMSGEYVMPYDSSQHVRRKKRGSGRSEYMGNGQWRFIPDGL